MKSLIPVILIIIAIYLFLLVFHTIGVINSPVFSRIFVIAFISVAIVLIALAIGLEQEIIRFVDLERIKGHTYEIEAGKKKYYFVGFKIAMRKKYSPEEEAEINPIAEVHNSLQSVFRNKARQLKVVAITTLNRKAGSAVVFYSEAEDWHKFVYEALKLKYVIEGYAPHIKLEPVGLKTSPLFPLPVTFEVGETE